MYDPGTGEQLHDFNPGIEQSGLFWTTVISNDDVKVDLASGTASFEMHDAHMTDFITFVNSIAAVAGIARPGSVSFKVTWDATGPAVVTDLPTKPFYGEHAPADAQMEWTGRTPDYEFASHPIGTSSSPFGALLGHERNGSMY